MTPSSTPLPPLTTRQRQRSAESTIAGYLYQFERSVVEILDLASDGEARIEGIEDIDLWSGSPEIIQVKYYEAQRWSLKAVRNAVLEMLKSFAAGLRVNYVLYVHFGDGVSPPERVTVPELKECLTYKPKGQQAQLLYKAFKERDLTDFVALFEIRCGVSLEDQRLITIAKISDALGCDRHEAEVLHRMRAVQFLHEVATAKDEAKRTVSKADLLRVLNVRDLLYHRWHKEVVGYDAYIDAAVRRLKRLNFNTSNSYRGVLLELTEENLESVGNLALELAKDMDGTARQRTTSAKPWTLVLRGHDDLVLGLKRKLIDSKVHFNDGYEHIQPSLDIFSAPAVVNSSGGSSRLGKASYWIRVISEPALRTIIDQDHRLAQLLVLSQPDVWHTQMTRSDPTIVSGLSINDLTTVLRRVNT